MVDPKYYDAFEPYVSRELFDEVIQRINTAIDEVHPPRCCTQPLCLVCWGIPLPCLVGGVAEGGREGEGRKPGGANAFAGLMSYGATGLINAPHRMRAHAVSAAGNEAAALHMRMIGTRLPPSHPLTLYVWLATFVCLGWYPAVAHSCHMPAGLRGPIHALQPPHPPTAAPT